MQKNKEIEINAEDKVDLKNVTHCFICGEKFKECYETAKAADEYPKVRDHCLFTCKYRGCAHSICKLNCCHKYFKIPVLSQHEKL